MLPNPFPVCHPFATAHAYPLRTIGALGMNLTENRMILIAGPDPMADRLSLALIPLPSTFRVSHHPSLLPEFARLPAGDRSRQMESVHGRHRRGAFRRVQCPQSASVPFAPLAHDFAPSQCHTKPTPGRNRSRLTISAMLPENCCAESRTRKRARDSSFSINIHVCNQSTLINGGSQPCPKSS